MISMRSSGIVVIFVMVSLILAAGCTGYPPLKATDVKNSTKSGSHNISSGGNDLSALVGPWYVKALVIEGIPKVPVRLTGIQLTFQNNGSFSGYDSCNPYAGLWQADEKQIKISRILSPLTYCGEPPGVMEQESEYFALLRNASSYGVNGEDMVLSDTTGKNGLIFKKVYF
jgi:heat shock protein HslJ